jgi:SET domain-containing protein
MCSNKKYRSQSWIDSRLEVRPSHIEGSGIFAKQPISVGEITMIWGGEIWSNEETTSDKVRHKSLTAIDDEHYLGSSVDAPVTIDEYLNHSCNPNMWLTDECTVVARLPINTDDEVTCDMCMFLDENYIMTDSCRCGTATCRQRITGKDWMLPELQLRYAGHFATFINKKIAAINELDNAK